MNDPRRFDINRNEVAAKVIEGEAIIMNLTTGAYYSMLGAGAAAWEAIERGLTVDEAAEALAAAYDVATPRVREDLSSLVASLLDEGLLVESASGEPDPKPLSLSAETRGEYTTPALEKFTDMADLLALDPPMPGFDETPWAAATEE